MKKNIVKNKSFEFSLKIIELYKILQSQKEYVISKQLLRSGTSIGANIAESEAGISRADFTYKLTISSKEARETIYWLQLLEQSNLVTLETDLSDYIKDCNELIRLLTAIVKTINSESN
ncbi:four helix bundle protein [Mesonia maritima]|uniref:Four helix bundle protein n=1 Tax=Mesonia maritima TaxID=1793873 RepID=A0ABU1K8D5_9FLAO|nr:four helix bundle protein [Mesonia maritima]MDR6301869.1 four helix bundle protein [Mesonia maritima]